MKKTPLLLIVFCILISSGLQAQNYQTVNSGRIAYFTTTGEDFQFLRIDSVSFNGDSIFYPNRTLGQVGYHCISPNEPSWSGRKIIVRKDGSNVYYNYHNDSILIKTQAILKEKWIAFHSKDSITFKAEVVAVDLKTVLGQLDSVKTIQFQGLDSHGNVVDPLLNAKQINISKNYGLVTSLNFNLFPNIELDYSLFQKFGYFELVGLTSPKLGFQNLTWFDVFDYQPGDIFHIEEIERNVCQQGVGATYYKRIISNYFNRTNYNDSIIYKISRVHHFQERYFDSIHNSIKFDTIRFVIYPDVDFDKLSGELMFSHDSLSIESSAMSIGDRIVKLPRFYGFRKTKIDSCWFYPTSDGVFQNYYFKGLGGPYYNYGGACPFGMRTLVYYKKGSVTWGTPFDFTGVETLKNRQNVNVYPNPAFDKICIETFSSNESMIFELYSTGGSVVFRQIIQSAKQDVDVSPLNNGIYFYKVSTSGQILKNGKITILH